MKIKILFAALMIITYSCNEPSDLRDHGFPIEPIDLSFTIHTKQDQMADFAENAMVIFDGRLWSVGGVNSYSAGMPNSDVWNSTNGINWTSVTSDRFEARIGHTLTVFDEKMWLIGGENSAGVFLSDIWCSDGTTWTNVTATAPFGGIAFHSSVVFDGRMYVIAPDLANNTTAVWSTMNGRDWAVDAPDAFPIRGGHKAVVFDEAIYVIGGRDVAGFRPDQIWRSIDGATWEEVTTSLPSFSARAWHTTTVYHDKVFIIGGQHDLMPYSNEIWYSENLTDWIMDTPGTILGLKRHSALVYAGEMYVFGGFKASGTSGQIFSIRD